MTWTASYISRSARSEEDNAWHILLQITICNFESGPLGEKKNRIDMVDAAIEEAANLICTSVSLSVFTGAGISVESGIADFRSPGGLWSRQVGSYDYGSNDP